MKARIFFVAALIMVGCLPPTLAQSPKCLFRQVTQKKAVCCKTPAEPAVVIPPLPTEEEIPLYDFSTYEGGIEAAIADLQWRKDRQAIWIAKEEDIMQRLTTANEAPQVLTTEDEDLSVLSERGPVSGDVLRDSQLRLKVAAAVSRKHGESQLSERFEAEADWVSQWRGMAEMNPHPAERQRRLWMRIATVWARNAEAIAGKFVVKDEPFNRLVGELTPEAAKSIQSGSVWSSVFGIDQFYSMTKTTDPRQWLLFKLIPQEFFYGEGGVPQEISSHEELQRQIQELAEVLSY